MRRVSRSRPKKKAAALSSNGSSPRYGPREGPSACPAPAGASAPPSLAGVTASLRSRGGRRQRLEGGEKVLEGQPVVDVDAAGAPQLLLHRLAQCLDGPRSKLGVAAKLLDAIE